MPPMPPTAPATSPSIPVAARPAAAASSVAASAAAAASSSASPNTKGDSSSTGTLGEPAKVRDLVQAIASDFYNVADPEGKPVAGLLVLLDSKRRPVRAELHLGGSTTEEAGRQAIRQAQHILEERYFGPDSLPLQVWQSFLRSEPLHVPLPPAGSKSAPASSTASMGQRAGDVAKSLPWRPILYGLGALLVAGLLWWIIAALRGDSAPTEPTSGGITVPVTGETTTGTLALTDTLAVDIVEGGLADAAGEGLAASQFAPADIVPGRRVRMVPGLTQSVLDQPSAGAILGTLTPETTVMVVGGPEQLAGTSDTIVWLEVELESGATGWVAANTSSGPLLELAD